MKKIIFYISWLLLLAGLYSCQDSLGYDPNVQSTEIIRDTVIKPPDGNAPTSFMVDSVVADFTESFKHNNRYFEIPWVAKTIQRKIVMDTSGTNKSMSFEWTAESANNDDDFRGMMRMDRVAGFEINFSSLFENRRFLLDGVKDNGRWFNIRIKKIRSQEFSEFSEKSIKATLSIIDIDRLKGTIKMVLEADIVKNTPIQTKRFNGIIEIFYKK